MACSSSRDLLLSGAGLAMGLAGLSLGVGTACGLAPSIGVTSTAAVTALAAGTLAWSIHRLRQERRQVQCYLERLANQAFEALPALEAKSSWTPLLTTLREQHESAHARTLEAEHARASLDVRLRRAMADHERIEHILAAVAEPVLAVGSYGEILLANRAAEQLFDLSTHKPEKPTLAQLGQCDQFVGLLKDALRRKSPTSRTEEFELGDASGQKRWYAATAATLATSHADDTNEPDTVVAVLRDISGQRAIQKQHAEFVSSASHEMKAPLAGIKAYVELLADGDAEDEQTREEFLHVINSQTDRLQRLVENLLNIARIEAGVVKVSKQPWSLNEILNEALHVIQPAAEAKQIHCTAQLSPLFLGVLADRDMLLQSAINLLSNAVKYTATGGTVTLRSRMLDEEVQFEVEDTGVGLSEEDCSRVFDKFYRVDKDKNMAQGTGLGLPLAKHIVEDVHGGRLTLRSQLGVGSTFIVTLPGGSRSS